MSPFPSELPALAPAAIALLGAAIIVRNLTRRRDLCSLIYSLGAAFGAIGFLIHGYTAVPENAALGIVAVGAALMLAAVLTEIDLAVEA